MKNILAVVLSLIFAASCYAASGNFFSTGTATSGTTMTINILKDGKGKISQALKFFNDGTNEVYVDFSGMATSEAVMSAEVYALTISPTDEPLYLDDFKTNKVKIKAKRNSSKYRLFVFY